jgi:Tol biopolymer transport system component
MSTATSGGVANGASGPGTISCDGAYVAFPSIASNLVTGDTNGNADVFLVDRITGTVKDVTILGNGGTDFSHSPQLSCDGTTLIFTSDASNLVSGDTNGYQDIFAYDTYSGTTEKVTVSSSGAQSTRYPDTDYSTGGVSYDGRYVVFGSYDNGLVSGDTNAHGDVYLRDRKVGTTEIISMRSSSTPTTDHSFHPAISDNGKYVVYMSNDNGLVSGDTNGTVDIFVSQTGV